MFPPHLLLLSIMAFLTVLLLNGRRHFDAVLAGMHKEEPQAWEAAGKPIGFFWHPEDVPLREGLRARHKIFRSYMRQRPPWLDAHPPLQRQLLLARLWIYASLIGYAVTGVSLLFVQGVA